MSDFADGAAVAGSHHGALIETCQRIEAVTMEACSLEGCATRQGEAAFEYLCSLAAGLESVVLGETEILGQIRTAARHASPQVERLLARSVAVARAFRRRERLAADAGQLFDLGLEAAGGDQPQRVLVAGSGPTARRVAARASQAGAQVIVSSRTRPAWLNADAEWTALEQISEAETDVAFICLGGDAPSLAAGSVNARAVIDVSTPRRTDPCDGRVITLRELRERTMAAEHERREALKMALKGDVRQAIESWRADSTSPVGRLRQSVEQLRQEELRRLRQRHPEIPEATMEALTRSMVNRMFHHPVIRLKTLEPDLAASVADLFATPAAGSRE